MPVEIKRAKSVDFVLPAVFGRTEKAVAISSFDGDERFRRRTARAPASRDVDIVRVGNDRYERFQPRSKSVRHAEIYGMIPFADVECAAVRLDALDNGR